MTQNNFIQKGLIVGMVVLFLTIGLSPIINAQQSSSFGSMRVYVYTYGHQEIPISGATVVLLDQDKHNFIRIGWTFAGGKTFYLLPVGHTYVIYILFLPGRLHSTSVKVTTNDEHEYVFIWVQ